MEATDPVDTDASPPESDPPRSTSSAMPDLQSANVPRLKARVHQRLSDADCARIPLSALRFRPLGADDFDEMIALHTEWFPVSYDEAFYNKSVQGEIFTLVATHSLDPADCGAGRSSSSTACGARGSEELLGMITMSTTCEHHCDDIMSVLGADCATICKRKPRSRDSPDDEEDSDLGCLAYILTLGVVDGFRRRGLARELLRQAVLYVNREMPHVHAIYLHVVTYNLAAIALYESMKFLLIGQFNSFYFLHGQPYDSFLYALYVHSGRPPWKWRLKNFLGLGFASHTWREWVMSALSSFWRPDTLTDKPPHVPLEAEVP
mmetsp:Transcript_26177/g.59593  ORF Transcript_26177/g.59593 Transcript_26177/m.59593 type:complete len:320 (-) Transcript_26177:120-1079(-)